MLRSLTSTPGTIMRAKIWKKGDETLAMEWLMECSMCLVVLVVVTPLRNGTPAQNHFPLWIRLWSMPGKTLLPLLLLEVLFVAKIDFMTKYPMQ